MIADGSGGQVYENAWTVVGWSELATVIKLPDSIVRCTSINMQYLRISVCVAVAFLDSDCPGYPLLL